MKLIIAGSRHLSLSYNEIGSLVSVFNLLPTEVVCGGANGIDSRGAAWAKDTGKPIKYMLADWDEHGRAAGPIRNKQMAEYADALLLIWDGESNGSASMLREMKKLKKPIYEVILKEHNE